MRAELGTRSRAAASERARRLTRGFRVLVSIHMGLVFTGIVYVSGYLFLLLVAVCVASGLYYITELVEQHTVLTGRLIQMAIVAVAAVHIACAIFESLPLWALGVGLAAHACYFWLLQTFPVVKLTSPACLASLLALVGSHLVWGSHFISHFHQTTHVLCFFVLNVWLVPFGFFVSLTANESTLPKSRGV